MLMLLGPSAGIPACDGSGVAGGGRFETTEMEGSGGCRAACGDGFGTLCGDDLDRG